MDPETLWSYLNKYMARRNQKEKQGYNIKTLEYASDMQVVSPALMQQQKHSCETLKEQENKLKGYEARW